MKYYLIAGEASGDLHGSNLMRGLLKSDPAARFRFWGGDRMAEVGGAENRVRDYRETSFFGIVGVLRNLGTISRQLRECPRRCAALRPRRADPRRLPGLQHEDGALRQRARHPHLLLHRPESVGVARMAREGDPPVRRPALHHLPLRTRLLSPPRHQRPVFGGEPLLDAIALGRRRSPRARSSAVRTDWTNGPWWRSWRAAAAAKSKPTCR